MYGIKLCEGAGKKNSAAGNHLFKQIDYRIRCRQIFSLVAMGVY